MSTIDTWIVNADVVTPFGVARCDVGLQEGSIAAITTNASDSALEIVEAKGCLLVPGMIDAHVHFLEPGRALWEGFQTGSRAAAAGGVTTVFDMPFDSIPATTSPLAFAAKQAVASPASVVDFQLWGGITPDNLDQLEALHQCGVIGFKACLSGSPWAEHPNLDPDTLLRGMEIVSRLPGMRVAVHAEDDAVVASHTADARRHGISGPRAFVSSRPIEAETRAITQVLEICQATGCPVHIAPVSAGSAMRLVMQAKDRGIDVTAETCPHYLTMTETSMDEYGALAKCAPPLRSAAEHNALWTSLGRGEIDTIASGHFPCPAELRRTTDFLDAWNGISGVQHALPIMYGEARARGIPLEHIARMCSSAPAEIFRLGPDRGRIQLGARADLCLLRPSSDEPIRADELLYRHRQSPYVGRDPGMRVLRTWVQGIPVFSPSRATGRS